MNLDNKKKVENCKPFIALSIIFFSASIILTRIMIYFYFKSRIKMFYLIEFILDKKLVSALKQDFDKVS